jgi:glycosyltransferase involved in cell wall biosynthesis
LPYTLYSLGDRRICPAITTTGMRIAIWLQGGIGGGNYSQGYPPLFNFILRISATHEVTVYSIFPPNKDFVPAGFKIRSSSSSIKNVKLRTLLLLFLFAKDFSQKRFDLLHAFWVYPAGTLAVIMSKIFRVPSIVTIQGGEAAAIPEIGYGNMLKPTLRRITLWTCENATVLNSISTFLLKELHKHGLKRIDGVVTPFGTETSLFTFEPKPFTDVVRLIHVANLTEIKDQETILKAVELLSKIVRVHLTVVGADYLDGKLQRMARCLSIDQLIHFAGPVPQKELPMYYHNADFMVHTSLHEGQSGVVMEAMSCGVVVCATPVGLVYDLQKSCFSVVNFRDAKALADNVFELWSNRTEYEKLQANALSYARTCDANWTEREYLKLYSSLEGR